MTSSYTSQSSLRNSSFARPELYQSQITFFCFFVYTSKLPKNPDSESKFEGKGPLYGLVIISFL